LQFIYQESEAFAACNEPAFLEAIKTPAGLAAVAGVELTLLDCVRYMHRAGGINSVAQIVKDIGSEADTRRLARAATHYEGASVRRLGYLLELAGHGKQARALHSFAESAKHFAPLDPGVKPRVPALAEAPRREPMWKLELNETIDVDA
jgi:predicted transcriptional regulator of viral defense system